MNIFQYFKDNKIKTNFIVEKGRKIIYKREFNNCKFAAIKIPNSVEIIEEEAFENSPNLVFVYFERNSRLNLIKEQAFFNCQALENIELPKSLEKIEFNVFGATSISENQVIYKGAKYIGTYANPYLMLYESCYENSFIRIHPKAKYILNSAFLDDDKLEKISFNKGLLHIGEYAFDGCNNLKSIHIKKEFLLKEISQGAFDNCNSLSQIIIDNKKIKVNRKNVSKKILKFAKNSYF